MNEFLLGRALARLAFDAAVFGIAYYVAYLVRFDGQVPGAYRELLMQTLPFAVLGGLVCLALTGTYSATGLGSARVVNGVALATVALVAYAAVVQPRVASPRGFVVLNVPAGVCVLFALTAVMPLLLSRAAFRLLRA